MTVLVVLALRVRLFLRISYTKLAARCQKSLLQRDVSSAKSPGSKNFEMLGDWRGYLLSHFQIFKKNYSHIKIIKILSACKVACTIQPLSSPVQSRFECILNTFSSSQACGIEEDSFQIPISMGSEGQLYVFVMVGKKS